MTKDTKSRSMHRIQIIRGQVEALERQISSQEYCMDILTQSLAIQRSLASLNKLVVKNHIETHIQQMLGSSNEAEHQQAVTELLQLYELSNIRGK